MTKSDAAAVTHGTGRSCSSIAKRALRYLERLFAIIGLGLVVFHCCLMWHRISSPSMHPTLQGKTWATGDEVLSERVSYWVRNPRRWEVVTFRRDDGTINMKRVIALPGEHLRILKDGRVLINGQRIKVPPELSHLRYYPIGNLTEERTFHCEDGYYILGDDSRDSDDSRYNGVLGRGQVLGRAWLITGPWNRIGFVNGH